MRLTNPVKLIALVNRLYERFSFLTDEKTEPFTGITRIEPPNRFRERSTETRPGLDQSQVGTEPSRELLERSRTCKCVRFRNEVHETVPFSFLDGRTM